jgi:aryl-alcohol dehydrogenase-like predicted oxidoreductase
MPMDYYRLLGRSGLRVSPLCLGTMTFGEEWGWGASKDESRRVFDTYAARGGNFIDTANFYTGGTSETFLGEFLKDRRDQFVLATKFALTMRQGDPNASGDGRKNIRQSVEASLKRLKTDYIDLYWLHIWDKITPIEEVMRALDDCVRSGKVLYVGVSDMAAWKVAQANTLATLRGWSPFVALQIEYSLIERTPERDLIPMSMDLGVGVTPWSPLAGGILTGKYSKKDNQPKRLDPNTEFGQMKLTQRNLAITDEVVKVAQEMDRPPAQVALNWVVKQPGITSTILGARNVRQLEDNLASLDFELSPDQLHRLDRVSKIELGFPHDFLNVPSVRHNVTSGTRIFALFT